MAKRKVFGISKDLNEGMSQTINAVKNNPGQLRYEVIPLVRIKFDPSNPRKLAIKSEDVKNDGTLLPSDALYDRKKRELESIKSLASSIKKQGVRHAIEVYKDGIDYRLISGERRVLASLLAGKEDIQARIIDVKPTEFDIRYLQWIENIEREDLSIWERIQNVRQLVSAYTKSEQVEMTATSLKDIIGCSLPHAMTYLAILQAPADIQDLLMDNIITNLEKAAFLAKITDDSLRKTLVNACVTENASLAELKKIVSEKNRPAPSPMPVRKQGRAAKRVTLGHTNSINVARKLMDGVLATPVLSKYSDKINNVDWNDYTSVSKAFQKLIKLLENEI
jgi:ParB family chromosome partitioning protein